MRNSISNGNRDSSTSIRNINSSNRHSLQSPVPFCFGSTLSIKPEMGLCAVAAYKSQSINQPLTLDPKPMQSGPNLSLIESQFWGLALEALPEELAPLAELGKRPHMP